jgi:hypothetical protein
MMTFLGSTWGVGALRFSAEQIAEFTRNAAAEGGVISWDVPPQQNGLFYPEFIEVLRGLDADLAGPWREKITEAVIDQPLISETGASRPGRARFRVKNLSTGPLTGTLAPRSEPREALAFPGGAVPYALDPGQETDIFADFEVVGGTEIKPRIGAEGSTITVPVLPRRGILVPRLPEGLTAEALEEALAGVKSRPLLSNGVELAQIRLALSGPSVALQAEVTDRHMHRGSAPWESTCVEVWGAAESSAAGTTPQFFLQPALEGRPASATRVDVAHAAGDAPVPEISIGSRNLPEGYLLTALLPLKVFGVDSATEGLVLELGVSTTLVPEQGIVRERLFGSIRPWNNTLGFGLLIEAK